MTAYDAIANELETNMSRDELLSLLERVKSINKSVNWPYSAVGAYDRESLSGYNQYYWVPTSLKSNVIRLHSEFYSGVKYSPSSVVTSLSATMDKLWLDSLDLYSSKLPKPGIKNPSAAKKSMTVKWKALSKKEKKKKQKIEVAYSLNKNFSDGSITKYKQVSKWSKVKKVKVK